jgi:subtilisin family serine protease
MTPITARCFVFDFVLSPGTLGPDNTGYAFAAGTSMAAPAVAGVAALIVEKHGGSMKPAQVEAALRQSADDLGKPGNDAFYGHGSVNALRAVQ